MKELTIIIFLWAFHSSNANYCKCKPISVAENFERSAAVFEGELIKTDTVGWTREILAAGNYHPAYLATLKILKQYKGNFYSDTVLIFTGENFGWGDCGYDFGVSNKHVIYASHRKYNLVKSCDPDHKKFLNKEFYYLETSYCDRTTSNIQEERNNIIKYLAGL